MTLIEALRLALQHYQSGRLDEAAMVCRAILNSHPEQVETLQILGVVDYAAGRLAEARVCLRKAIQLKPDSVDAYTNLGVVRQNAGFAAEAVRLQTRALRLRPDMNEAWLNRGTAHLNEGNRDRAFADFQRASLLRPGDVGPVNSMGMILRERGQIGLSIALHERAVRLSPTHADSHRDLAHALRESGRLSAAAASYATAYALDPKRTESLSYHLFAKQAVCDWTDYEALCRETRAVIDEDRGIVLPLAALAIDTTPEQQLRAARRFAAEVVRPTNADPAAPRPPSAARPADGRLTIAYFSADFHEHATAYLAAEMFELHDRERFRVLGYSFGFDDDSPMRRRLIDAFDVFRDIRSVGLDEVARLVAADGVDILIDLKGYTKQSRLDLLSRRLAPIEVTYLGYPGTTGCGVLDYAIGDRFVTPLDHQPHYSERLVAMPDSYQVNDRHRPLTGRTPNRADCGLPEGSFVFCAFNTTYKINPMMFGAWMRLLHAVPDSVLWLFEANPEVNGNLRREAAARGIDPARLVFAPKRPLADHLARYRVADLGLDSFPYTGHTTTSDALWMGMPVVTLMGGTFASRVAAGLLNAAGVPETITTSLADYEALALALVHEPNRLAGLRRRLEETRMTVPLFDSRRFTRHIERAYEEMWRIHAAGQPPRPFAVAPDPQQA